jgi:hypothetical protein
MYVRFEILALDTRTGKAQGLFQAAGMLLESDRLETYESECIREALKFFNANLYVPQCLKSKVNRRALSYFKADSQDMISRIWDLVALIRNHGLHVRVINKRVISKIIYEDKHQVVAFP